MSDRSRPPALAPPRATRFPPVVERLPWGARGPGLWVAAKPAVPLLEIVLALPDAGAEADPPGRAGAAWLCSAAIDEGTRRRDSREIARSIERLGGSLGAAVDWDAGYLQAHGLAPDLPEILDLVAEILCEPTFPEREVERLRRQRSAELLRRRDQAAALAAEHLVDLLYPGAHPYGRLLGGNERSLERLDRATCVEFHARRWRDRLAAARLVVVGDVDADRVEAEARRAFGPGLAHTAVAPPTGGGSGGAEDDRPAARREPAPLDRPRVRIVDRPGAAQTELRAGHAGPPRTDPGRATLRVLNALLGGKFTSRLNLNLRERHGFTYGASSRFGERRGPAPFVVGAAIENEAVAAAAREVLAELSRLREETPAALEVEDAKAYLIGVFPFTLQTASDLARYLEDLAVFDLPLDEPDRQLQAIAAVTPEDLQRAAIEHLHPEAAAVVAVGPGEALRRQFLDAGWNERDLELAAGPPERPD